MVLEKCKGYILFTTYPLKKSGSLFAFERYGVVPDILLVAKGMGGGLPIGAFVSSSSIMASLSRDPVLGHINTFGGNAVCIAAALACLEVIVEEKLDVRANKIETQVKQSLIHPRISEVRMVGALGAVQFASEEVNHAVIKKCLQQGLVSDWFLFCPKAMRIAPPLNISESELSKALEILLGVLKDF